MHAARDAAAGAQVDVAAALAWRDFMVSDYSDAGQERWLTAAGIDVLRGSGRLAGPGVVQVDGARHTAEHVVVATGAEPFIPPIPGLRELDGVWTNREATGLKAVPRRLLVLGGGPVGVEMAQAVHRLGSEVTLVHRGEHLLGGEPAPLATPRRVKDGVSFPASRRPPRGAKRRTMYCNSATAASCAATSCSLPPAGARASTASGSRPLASSPTRTGSQATRRCVRASDCGRSATSPASSR